MNLGVLALAASVWLAVGGVASAGPTRFADNRRIIGILDLRVEGLPDELRDSFQHDLEYQLDVKQYYLANRARMKLLLSRSTKWTDGCLVGACLAEARAKTGADLVLLIALTGAGTSFGHVITLVRTDTGRVLAQDADHCDVCTMNEATARATLATIGLLNNLPDKLPDDAADQAATIAAAASAVRVQMAAHDRHTTRVGIALTVLGLAAATTGVTLLAVQDNRPHYAALTAVGGGALALGGITVLAF